MNFLKRLFRIILRILKWLFSILMILAVISGLYNLTLPRESSTTDKLSDDQKAFVSEAWNLQREMGNKVWPAFGDTLFPVIVYNEAYAFLIGIDHPSAGWKKIPSDNLYGNEWEIAEDCSIDGMPCYRQALNPNESSPENFTVLVGERYVTSIQTKEYAEISFYKGFKKQLPPVINWIFPYKLFWNVLIPSAENYVVTICHESFHSFQGHLFSEKLRASEKIMSELYDYPWDNVINQQGWELEVDYLMEALQTDSDEELLKYVSMFSSARQNRRLNASLTPQQIDFEKRREWSEGLAKYVELQLGLMAGQSPKYNPIDQIKDISGFENYDHFTPYFDQQLSEINRAVQRPEDNRFYYTGLLQALVLDKLGPEWKEKVFEKDIYIDDILFEINEKN